MAGSYVPGWQAPKQTTQTPYQNAVKTTGADYDDVMNRYRRTFNPDPQYESLFARFSNPNNFQNYSPERVNYRRSKEVEGALGNLGELSKTGGYSEEGIADLRARGISPIRAVYANAQRNIDRQRSLQGGYSPNYTAATAKMARDLSESIATQTSNVNAGIAEAVAKGRLAAAPEYARAALGENAARTGVDTDNANRAQRAAEFNSQNQRANENLLYQLYAGRQDNQLRALQGMTQMYGTTPGLPQLYGNQQIQQGQLALQNKQIGNQAANTILSGYRYQPQQQFRLG